MRHFLREYSHARLLCLRGVDPRGRPSRGSATALRALQVFRSVTVLRPFARGGRRDAENLRAGDALDFWRVESYEPPQRLRLLAEMKHPGRAWLECEVMGNERGSTIRQTAIFDPVGLGDLLYWYGIFPLHQLVFAGMLRNIAHMATNCEASPAAKVIPDDSAGKYRRKDI